LFIVEVGDHKDRINGGSVSLTSQRRCCMLESDFGFWLASIFYVGKKKMTEELLEKSEVGHL